MSINFYISSSFNNYLHVLVICAIVLSKLTYRVPLHQVANDTVWVLFWIPQIIKNSRAEIMKCLDWCWNTLVPTGLIHECTWCSTPLPWGVNLRAGLVKTLHQTLLNVHMVYVGCWVWLCHLRVWLLTIQVWGLSCLCSCFSRADSCYY